MRLIWLNIWLSTDLKTSNVTILCTQLAQRVRYELNLKTSNVTIL